MTQQLAVVARQWKIRFTDRVRRLDQTDGRWKALYALGGCAGGMIQSELAKRIGVQGPTLVKLLDALEAQGLVSRRTAPGDRRAKVIVLEPEGRRVLVELDRIAAQMRAEVLAELSDQDLIAGHRMLEQIAGRLRRG